MNASPCLWVWVFVCVCVCVCVFSSRSVLAAAESQAEYSDDCLPSLLPFDHPHVQLAWLMQRPCLNLHTVGHVFERCLLDDLKQQV